MGLHADKTMAAYEMPTTVAEYAQKKFIEARQGEHDRDGKIKTDDFAFHRYLTLARYMSIGKMGSLELTIACYEEARELELSRVAREEARLPPTPK